MKTVAKTFYVDDETIKYLKDYPKAPYHFTGMTSFLNKCKYGENTNKVTITWEEEEKKVEVTESQIDEMINRYVTSSTSDFAVLLKREIFKK